MIQDFIYAKTLARAIAKHEGLKNEDDWIRFTKSKKFKQFENVLPKRPWSYYSKQNVIRRSKI